MRIYRLVITACATSLLIPSLGGSAALSAPHISSPLRYYAVGFDAAPSGLSTGSTFHGARVERVDRVLDFARVATRDPQGFLARATADGRVSYVEPDPVRKLIEYTPNDPSFASQYGPQHVRAPEAWDTTLGDVDAEVCVVDTGVRYTHEDIAGNRWLGGIDYVNNDSDPDDDHGHGTHVAGIAAGGLDNDTGISGLGNVGIHGVKVLDSQGFGAWTWVAQGIRWCADNGGPRTVINMSIGGIEGAQVLQDAVTYAYGKGALLVAAAANSGPCTNCVQYPAKYYEVIGVTCTTETKTQCGFSSDGPESELTAPGSQILSSYHTNDTAYQTLSGTSMSTPHVSGVAALVWSHTPDVTSVQLRKRLRDTAQDLGTTGWDELYGYGLVDGKAAIDAGPPPPPPPPQTTIYSESFDDGVADGWTLGGLWHASSLCAPAPPSAPNYLGYNRDADCTFNTGGRTTGSATFDVDLTNASLATLKFSHRSETEQSGGAYDIRRVQVSTDGGASFLSLRHWDARDANVSNWTAQSLPLDPFVGGPIKIRFFFDSVDGQLNAFDGWLLDNVEVTSNAEPLNISPVANAGPDQTVTDAEGNGTEVVTLDGTGSSDSDGAIASYVWEEGGAQIAIGATPAVDFAVGTHNVTLTVTDDDTATATDDVVITVNPAGGGTTLYLEDFDDGTADGWRRSGLWHVSSACAAAPSPPMYLGHNRDTNCQYSSSTRTVGNAVFDIDLTGQAGATLIFDHRFEKEVDPTVIRDQLKVQVWTANTNWVDLRRWDSRDANQLNWTSHSVNLNTYVGQPARIKFLFDSIDGVANDYAGWFIDNVAVTSQ